MTEQDQAKFEDDINVQALKLSNLWLNELKPHQIDAAISRFRRLAPIYMEAGMPAKLAILIAEKTALAVASHNRKVRTWRNSVGDVTSGQLSSLQIAEINQNVRIMACAQIMWIMAEKLGVSWVLTAKDIDRAQEKDPNYETAPITAYLYFSQPNKA